MIEMQAAASGSPPNVDSGDSAAEHARVAEAQKRPSGGAGSGGGGGGRNRGCLSRELRDLLPDVCVRQPKRWPAATSPAHAALCDALDEVLGRLRALGPVAEPFLSRVTKTDAPDYAEVVRNPMDLGTMARKLRAGTYSSAAEFATDMDLIAYNAACFNGPQSPFTHMAASLRTTARGLLAALPASEEAMAAREQAPAEAAPVAPPPSAPAVPKQPKAAAVVAAAAPAAPPPPPLPCEAAEAPASKRRCLPREEALPPEATQDWRDCLAPAMARQAPPWLPPLPRGGGHSGCCPPPVPACAAVFSDEEHAAAAMRDALAPLLRHAGFQAAQGSAADTLTGVVLARMLRLGQELRRLADKHAAGLRRDAPALLDSGADQRLPLLQLQDCILRATGAPWTLLRDHGVSSERGEPSA